MASPKSPSKRTAQKPRKRTPSFTPVRGEHATVAKMRGERFKGKIRRVVRAPIQVNSCYSIGHAIAHLLYPRHFAEQVASDNPRSFRNRHQKTFWREKRLDDASKKGIRAYYTHGSGNPDFLSHERRVRRATFLLTESLWDAGIAANSLSMNVGFSTRGRPVFFEIAEIYPARIEATVQRMRPSRKKKQLERLLGALKKQLNESMFGDPDGWREYWNDWIKVHQTARSE